MGGVLTVAGLEGFLSNLDDLLLRNGRDRDGAELRGFVAAWWAAHGSERPAGADLVKLEPLPGRVAEKDTGRVRRLGNFLADLRGRRFTVATESGDVTVKVEHAGEYQRYARWQLVKVSP